MNLVEFPDDNIAFDPTKVTSIVGVSVPKISSGSPICIANCPGRYDGVDTYTLDYCEISDHYDITLADYTVVSVAGQELRVSRPFHDVMLVISANLAEPVSRKHDFFSARPESSPLPTTEEEEKAYLMRDWE